MIRYVEVRNAAVLLGVGLAALGGVFALWRAVRGPGRLPRTRTLAGYLLARWSAALYDWLYVIAGGRAAAHRARGARWQRPRERPPG